MSGVSWTKTYIGMMTYNQTFSYIPNSPLLFFDQLYLYLYLSLSPSLSPSSSSFFLNQVPLEANTIKFLIVSRINQWRKTRNKGESLCRSTLGTNFGSYSQVLCFSYMFSFFHINCCMLKGYFSLRWKMMMLVLTVFILVLPLALPPLPPPPIILLFVPPMIMTVLVLLAFSSPDKYCASPAPGWWYI